MTSPERTDDSFIVGTEQHFRWLDGIIRTTLVLNLLDAVFTLAWVTAGFAEEANPLLTELVRYPVLFMSAKLALVSLGSWALWRYRQRPTAVVAIFTAFLVYYLILLYHVDFLGDVLRALLA